MMTEGSAHPVPGNDAEPTGINRRRLGSAYEEIASEYIKRLGMTVLEQNFRTRAGEIDLIVMDGSTLVFVEVKYRRDDSKGSALEAVDRRKQQQIVRMAKLYLMKHRKYAEGPIRFDVIGITGEKLRHIKNAFGA